MGIGSKIKKAVKKVTKAVTKTVTAPIKAGASVANEIAKATGINAVSKITGEVKKGVYKAADVALSGTQNAIDAVFNPVGAIKGVIHNPLNALVHYSGLEALYKGNGVMGASGTVETPAAGTMEEQSPQDRARMLSRQGMQGTNPIMLLGQDFQPSELATDEELGGKGQ